MAGPKSSRNKAAIDMSNIVDQFKSAVLPQRPWDSIIDFATHPSFCGLRLYPRQQTLLKLIYLETENMTAYDIDVISQWAQGFKNKRQPTGVQEDIWERVEYLKERGYSHFPHIQAVQGRRASKGMIGGILGAERLAHMIVLDDPQAHYGIAEGKDLYASFIATNMIQAKKFLFADVRQTVEGNKWLAEYLSTSKEYMLSLRTPADKRRIAELQARGLPVEREIATIRAVAMSSSSSSGRGGSGFANMYDEMAHMLQGTGGPRTSEEVYDAYQPSLDQFGKDSLTYIPSSPFCLVPETKVLTERLEYVPVGSLEVGDKIIGFDEYPTGGKGSARKWRQSEVVETGRIDAPVYKMKVNGREITCTGEHLWLIGKRESTKYVRGSRADLFSHYDNPSQRVSWVKTSQLLPGDRIFSVGEPWEVDSSRDGGYVAGLLDGEGWTGLSHTGFSQKSGAVMDKVVSILQDRGIEFEPPANLSVEHEGRCKPACGCGISGFRVSGGYRENMRFLGMFPNERLTPRFVNTLYGKKAYNNRRSGSEFEVLESVEPAGVREVVTLETSTKTLIAEGLFSHNTKVGKFFELYTTGSVTIQEYREKQKDYRERVYDQDDLPEELEAIEQELFADPEMLIIQLPSWELYRDYERGPELVGVKFKRAIQSEPLADGAPENQRMARLEKRDPVKFKVERRAQFAEVMDAYLDTDKVDDMFRPFRLKKDEAPRRLERQEGGKMSFVYHGHSDPSKSNANFAIAVAHLEKSEIPDEHGMYWEHVVFDYLHVYQPKTFPDGIVDYVQVQKDIEGILKKYRSMERFTFDHWNSIGFIQNLSKFARKQGLRTQIAEESFNAGRNQRVAEQFKSALNAGWIHSYKDDFFDNGEGSLLEQELKFLMEKNGKVVKQNIGPVTTKDLADCVMEVSTRLLKNQLGRLNDLTRPVAGLQGGYPRSNARVEQPDQGVKIGRGSLRDRLAVSSARAGRMTGQNMPSRGVVRKVR